MRGEKEVQDVDVEKGPLKGCKTNVQIAKGETWGFTPTRA